MPNLTMSAKLAPFPPEEAADGLPVVVGVIGGLIQLIKPVDPARNETSPLLSPHAFRLRHILPKWQGPGTLLGCRIGWWDRGHSGTLTPVTFGGGVIGNTTGSDPVIGGSSPPLRAKGWSAVFCWLNSLDLAPFV